MKLKYIVISACMLFVASIAEAVPVVTFSTSGSSGAWLTDFSVTNNLGGTNDIYFFGVKAPTNNVVNSPSGWESYFNSWNNSSFGGSGITYNNTWINQVSGITSLFAPGQTLSGFKVLFTSATAPTSVDWFAFAAGGTYTGSDHFYTIYNPGFEGVAINTPVPEPETYAMLLAGLGLLGFTALRRKDLAV